jgi:glycerol-3-phosphate cytidylyltransferase
MKTVITYGTFDLFHIGHVNLLKRARSMGDRLVVGVSTDEFNAQKGKKTVVPYQHRAEIVASLKYVDDVFAEETWEQKSFDIKKYEAKVLVMGADWAGKFDDLKSLCEVSYLPRTQGISSSEIKNSLSTLMGDRLKELQDAIATLQTIVQQLAE